MEAWDTACRGNALCAEAMYGHPWHGSCLYIAFTGQLRPMRPMDGEAPEVECIPMQGERAVKAGGSSQIRVGNRVQGEDMRERKTGEDAPQNPSHRSTQRPDEDHGPARSDGRQHVSEDINAQAQPESRPSRPDRRFKVFLENLADVAYETDASGNLTYVNKMAKTVTGLSKEELIGRPFLPLVEEADRARAAEGYERTMAGEQTEFELTLVSGLVCHFKSEPLRDPDGRIIGVFGIARDISERRRAEEAVVESEETVSHGRRLHL